jgi:hypothetical protein
MRVAVQNRGIFGPFIGPRYPISGPFAVSRERGSRGEGRLREMNRIESGIGWRSGHWESIEDLSR